MSSISSARILPTSIAAECIESISNGVPFAWLDAWILAGLAATVLLVNALAYVWLYLGQPFMFRIWGFTFLAAGLAALPFVLWAFRINVHDLSGIREWIGRPRHWFAAVLIPLLARRYVSRLWGRTKYSG